MKAEIHISQASTGAGRGRGSSWVRREAQSSFGETSKAVILVVKPKQWRAGRSHVNAGGPGVDTETGTKRHRPATASQPLMSLETQPLRLGCWRTEKNKQHKASGQLPGLQRASSAQTQALPARSLVTRAEHLGGPREGLVDLGGKGPSASLSPGKTGSVKTGLSATPPGTSCPSRDFQRPEKARP